MTQCQCPCSIHGNALPDTCITISDTIHKGKIPTHTHKHCGVQTNVPIASIMKFAYSPPRLRHRSPRYIHRINSDSKNILIAHFYKICNVNVVIDKHSIDCAQQISIDPYFGTIVDTVRLQPDIFSFKRSWNLKFGTKPISIELTTYL